MPTATIASTAANSGKVTPRIANLCSSEFITRTLMRSGYLLNGTNQNSGCDILNRLVHGHARVVVLVTVVRPVVLTSTVRSWSPGLGEARQIFTVAEVAPTPAAGNVKL